MTETPWYVRMVRIRERWVVAGLLVAAFVTGLVSHGPAAVATKTGLVLLAVGLVVNGLRRPETQRSDAPHAEVVPAQPDYHLAD